MKTEIKPELEEKLRKVIPGFFDSEIARAKARSLKDLISLENKHFLETWNSSGIPLLYDLKYFLEKNNKSKVLLKRNIKNNILIDLGCGAPPSRLPAMGIVRMLEPSIYIGIDKYFEGQIWEKSPKNRSFEHEFYLENLDKIDALKFTIGLPSNFANFMLNAVCDDYVIKNHRYLKELAHEVHRATLQKGIVFGGLNPKYFEDVGFKRVDALLKDGYDLSILRKG